MPLRTVNMDEIERYLDKNSNGYTVFEVNQKRAGLSVGLKPVIKGKTSLKEIEDAVKERVVKWQDMYFAVKNNMSKVYVFEPNIKLQKNKAECTETKNCREAHPVYYAGMAPI